MNAKKAIISSTVKDLAEHRRHVEEACIRSDVLPKMMEYLPVGGPGAIKSSMSLVGDADIYIGVYAYRYGTIPVGYDVSYTELEFNEALEREMKMLPFLIDKEHLVTADMFELSPDAQRKLDELKGRVTSERERWNHGMFKSADDLGRQVERALVFLSLQEATHKLLESERRRARAEQREMEQRAKLKEMTRQLAELHELVAKTQAGDTERPTKPRSATP